MDIEPVRRKRLYQEVAGRLEHLIGSGVLSEGQLLPPERELMEQFEVGRPALREALLSLQHKGLVSINNGARARVTRPDAARLIEALSGAAQVYLSSDEGVRHFQATRRTFEGAVARDVARRAGNDDLARIGEALAANRKARGNRQLFGTTDVAFHLEIVRSSGNPLLIGIHQALSGWLTEQRSVSLAVKGAEARALAFHERIYEALVAHDPDAAEVAMHDHLAMVEADYWRRGR